MNAERLMARALAALQFVEQCKLGVQLAQRDLELAQELAEDSNDVLNNAKDTLRGLMQQMTITQQAELLQFVLRQG